MGNAIDLLELIRELAGRHPSGHATAEQIFNTARQRRIVGMTDIESRRLRKMILSLEQSGKIKQSSLQSYAWIPTDYNPSQIRKQIKEVEIDEAKIRNAMRAWFTERRTFPTPTEIHRKFEEIYGSVNSETLTRMVRKMFELGMLERTETHKYFYRDLLKGDDFNLKRYGR